MYHSIQKLKNTYHFLQALIANIYYGFPSRKLKVIGITGTDGKTTTTHLIYHILKTAGKKVSMISTVYAKVGGKEYDTGLHTTTPDPFLIQNMLKKSLDNGEEYFVLETTSHALDQNRVWGVFYEIGILTNVTHEHLDYHKDYEDYLNTKTLMLRRSRKAVVNKDDESYEKIQEILNTKSNIVTYGLKHTSDYSRDFRNTVKDLAEFNASNYLGAYAVARLCGIQEKIIETAIQTFILPPGRIDVVYKEEFTVIIDFAHTPNAIKKILEMVRTVYLQKTGRLIHVFGSAGLRDVSKRPLMGHSSGKLADVVVLTEEDYRTEDPALISQQIESGLKKEGLTYKKNLTKQDIKVYSIILNREKAISQALAIVTKGDVVIITGKGHEKSLCRGKVEYPWNDKDAVKRLLQL